MSIKTFGMGLSAVQKKQNAKRSDEKAEKNAVNSPTEQLLLSAAEAILEGEGTRARAILKQCMADDMENAEAFNLLGISYEREGNRLKASKFYRVAYYMDQTFQAAAENLERICGFWNKGSEEIKWGLNIAEVKSK